MKVIALVNGGFGVPSLKLLKESKHELIAIFILPNKARRPDRNEIISPVRQAINDFLTDVPVYEIGDINAPENVDVLKGLNADVIFICDYGKILSPDVIASTRYGCINLHGSLLPKYRGAAPINRAVQAGERELGVSIIFLEPQVDAGPIIAMRSYTPSLDDTAVEIENELASLGAPLVIESLDNIERGEVVSLPQDPLLVSKAPKLRKEEGRIDWSQSSEVIIDQYRAFQPWPRVFSDWVPLDQAKKPTRLILGPFSLVDEEGVTPEFDEDFYKNADFGIIVLVTKSDFWVKTSNGALRVLAIQPSGKKCLLSKDFLRGYRINVGDRLV